MPSSSRFVEAICWLRSACSALICGDLRLLVRDLLARAPPAWPWRRRARRPWAARRARAGAPSDAEQRAGRRRSEREARRKPAGAIGSSTATSPRTAWCGAITWASSSCEQTPLSRLSVRVARLAVRPAGELAAPMGTVPGRHRLAGIIPGCPAYGPDSVGAYLSRSPYDWSQQPPRHGPAPDLRQNSRRVDRQIPQTAPKIRNGPYGT